MQIDEQWLRDSGFTWNGNCWQMSCENGGIAVWKYPADWGVEINGSLTMHFARLDTEWMSRLVEMMRWKMGGKA